MIVSARSCAMPDLNFPGEGLGQTRNTLGAASQRCYAVTPERITEG
jgi:hypothetical protein